MTKHIYNFIQDPLLAFAHNSDSESVFQYATLKIKLSSE